MSLAFVFKALEIPLDSSFMFSPSQSTEQWYECERRSRFGMILLWPLRANLMFLHPIILWCREYRLTELTLVMRQSFLGFVTVRERWLIGVMQQYQSFLGFLIDRERILNSVMRIAGIRSTSNQHSRLPIFACIRVPPSLRKASTSLPWPQHPT